MPAQRRDDVDDGLTGVAVVDPISLGQQRARGRVDRVRRECGIDAGVGYRCGEGVEFVVWHEVVGEPEGDRVGAGKRCSRQRGVQAEKPWRPRQDERATDVGNEADTHFGHRHFRGVRDNANAAVDGEPDAATHHDAVHQRDVGLAEAPDLRVQHVLVVPEFAGLDPVGARAVVDRDDVAARAEPAFAGAGHHDGIDPVVGLPLRKHPRQGVDHGMCQRIDGLGPVERDQADPSVDSY